MSAGPLEDSYFYEQEDDCFPGLWHLALSPAGIDEVVELLCKALGEREPEVYHKAVGTLSFTRKENMLVFAATASALTVVHEVSHLVLNRNGYDAGPTGHDAIVFLFTCLNAAILEDTILTKGIR